MEPIKSKNLEFYFKPTIVVMIYHNQFIAFHAYGFKNKRHFNRFSELIQTGRFSTLGSVYGLARIHNIPSMSVSSSVISDKHLHRVPVRVL